MISIYVISAIAGNFWQESTLNPALWEGQRVGDWTEQRHGYGLGQWTNTPNSQRLLNLYNFLTSHGYSLTSAYGQWDFLIQEDTWYYSSYYQDLPNLPYHTLQEFLDSDSTDIAYLTHVWNRCWEGIHDESWDLRVDYANDCYRYILEHYDDESITQWITGNRYLSNAERRNNAVMLYRLLRGLIPPDPPVPPTTKKRKMPIYMMLKRRRF